MPLAVEPHEQKRAVVAAAEAGFEEADERQAAESQVESIDAHERIAVSKPTISCARACSSRILRRVAFRYLAIEGPIGVGKTRLAERLAGRIDGTAVLEDTDNPFLADFYNDRPGAALQAQLFYLLNRHRQLIGLRQADLFQHTIVCDYVFDRDKIFAYLNLDDNELFIYQRLYELLARDIPPPDLVDLSAGADRRAAATPRRSGRSIPSARCRSPTRSTCAS